VAAAPELRRPFLVGARRVAPLQADILAVGRAAFGGVERAEAADFARLAADDARRELPGAVPVAVVDRGEQRDALLGRRRQRQLAEHVVAPVVLRILERAVGVVD